MGDVQRALREELYATPYASIDWDGARNTCASIDLYAPHTAIMDVAVRWLAFPSEPTALISRAPYTSAHSFGSSGVMNGTPRVSSSTGSAPSAPRSRSSTLKCDARPLIVSSAHHTDLRSPSAG